MLVPFTRLGRVQAAIGARVARNVAQNASISAPQGGMWAIMRAAVTNERRQARRTISTGTEPAGNSFGGTGAGTSSRSLPAIFVMSAIAAFAIVEVKKAHTEANEVAGEDNPGMLVVTETGKRNDQVKSARDAPGVWLWGANRFGVAAPDAPAESPIRSPRILSFFNGWILRDLALAERHAAAIDINGDLYQWGAATSPDAASAEPAQPSLTVKGRGLQKVTLAQDKAYALGSDGTVYCVGTAPNASGPTTSSSSWFGLFGSSTSESTVVAKCTLPADARGEKIVDLRAGLHHVLALSSSGKIYTLAADSKGNAAGQLGLNQMDQPVGHEGFAESDPRWNTAFQQIELFAPVLEIASGDEHCIVRTKDGRAYAWGANMFGQLATQEFDETVQRVSYPREITTVWNRAGSRPKPGNKRAVGVAAGGNNSLIVVEDLSGRRPANEVFSSGMGQWGQLGNGSFNHVQNFPVKIKPLSGLLEWNEKESKVKPIGFDVLAIGATHLAAVMDNVYTDQSTGIEYGKDLMMWGRLILQGDG